MYYLVQFKITKCIQVYLPSSHEISNLEFEKKENKNVLNLDEFHLNHTLNSYLKIFLPTNNY